ncbi:MAG TPA: DUF6064 family protein, partial [Gemmatimonadaceae bacterium]|nr:DUF6064 family protein [Gemmatimonadaceae bacterium]
MRLPFTVEQFLEVFRDYNEAVWPAQWLLVAMALAAIVLSLRGRPADGRHVNAILALLWLWVAAAYHFAFFREVTAAAVVFAAAFAAQAGLFAWSAWKPGRVDYVPRTMQRGVVGGVLIAYALIGYPALGYLLGHRYPDAPTFGVPCPTTIFTIGLLVWAGAMVPRRLIVIPTLWAVVGVSAAVNLGMTEDVGLPIAAVL